MKSKVKYMIILMILNIPLVTAEVKSPPYPLKNHYYIGYFGELISHPGITLSIDHRISERPGLHWNHRSEVVFYLHRMHHSAIIFYQHIGPRFTFSEKKSMDILLGLGYMHSFLAGDLYIKEDAMIKKTIDLGRPHISPSLSIGINTAQSKFGMHEVRLCVFGQYPQNGILIPHLALSVSRRIH